LFGLSAALFVLDYFQHFFFWTHCSHRLHQYDTPYFYSFEFIQEKKHQQDADALGLLIDISNWPCDQPEAKNI